MNKITISGVIKSIFLLITMALLIMNFSACAKKISFQNSAVAPAARGHVKIKKDGNNNYNIQIRLLNLAESNRLEPAKNTYVVWMESDNSSAKNIGQIKSDINFMAKKLKAQFTTISPIKPTKIFITAEDDATTQYPGNVVVLTTNNL